MTLENEEVIDAPIVADESEAQTEETAPAVEEVTE